MAGLPPFTAVSPAIAPGIMRVCFGIPAYLAAVHKAAKDPPKGVRWDLPRPLKEPVRAVWVRAIAGQGTGGAGLGKWFAEMLSGSAASPGLLVLAPALGKGSVRL